MLIITFATRDEYHWHVLLHRRRAHSLTWNAKSVNGSILLGKRGVRRQVDLSSGGRDGQPQGGRGVVFARPLRPTSTHPLPAVCLAKARSLLSIVGILPAEVWERMCNWCWPIGAVRRSRWRRALPTTGCSSPSVSAGWDSH